MTSPGTSLGRGPVGGSASMWRARSLLVVCSLLPAYGLAMTISVIIPPKSSASLLRWFRFLL